MLFKILLKLANLAPDKLRSKILFYLLRRETEKIMGNDFINIALKNLDKHKKIN